MTYLNDSKVIDETLEYEEGSRENIDYDKYGIRDSSVDNDSILNIKVFN